MKFSKEQLRWLNLNVQSYKSPITEIADGLASYGDLVWRKSTTGPEQINVNFPSSIWENMLAWPHLYSFEKPDAYEIWYKEGEK